MAIMPPRYPRYRSIARKLWPTAVWIEPAKPSTRSPWATVSHCPTSSGKPAVSVMLHATAEQAILSLWYWPDGDTDQPARPIVCGGGCRATHDPSAHEIRPLTARAWLDSLRPFLKLRGA